jgi:hypothetical protein
MDTLAYLKKSGDAELSIESGLTNMSYPSFQAFEWVTTDTYQMINHGVNPVRAVADCGQCHGDVLLDLNDDSMLDVMGYGLK